MRKRPVRRKRTVKIKTPNKEEVLAMLCQIYGVKTTHEVLAKALALALRTSKYAKVKVTEH